ncbi:T9SS type A sorting domain-containing protein [bacterium]|nr:T9SS type A sorting domain-containing protein [bacterium]
MKYYLVFATIVLLSTLAQSQVVITPEDIPVEPGTESWNYLETPEDTLGIRVEVGEEGSNQEWDFVPGGTDVVVMDSLINPEEAPHIDMVPNTNRVSSGGGMLAFGEGYSYEAVTDSGWYALGMGMQGMEDLPIGDFLEFPDGLLLVPLPAQMGDEWEMSTEFSYFVTSDTMQMMDTLQLDFNIGGDFSADAWGTIQYPGGEAPALRIHFTVGMWIEGYAISWFLNQRIVIPLGELYRMDVSQNYLWFAPGIGEIARVAAMPGDMEPNFQRASSVERRFVPGWGVGEITPAVPIEINLNPAYPNPFNGQTRLTYSLNTQADLAISVYDIQGRLVDQLFKGVQKRGEHSLYWQAGMMPSGTYFVKLGTPENTKVQRVLLLK